MHASSSFPQDVAHYHVVPKPTGGDAEAETLWSVCLAVAENHVIINFPEMAKRSLTLCKALLSRDLHDYDRFKFNMVDQSLELSHIERMLKYDDVDIHRLFVTTKFQPKYLLDSYLLKVALLHVAPSHGIDPTLTTEEQLKCSVVEMFGYIKDCVSTMTMPHPFIEGFNVLAEDKHKNIERVSAQYLRLQCAEEFLARLHSNELTSKDGLLNLGAEDLLEHMQRALESYSPERFVTYWTRVSNSDQERE